MGFMHLGSLYGFCRFLNFWQRNVSMQKWLGGAFWLRLDGGAILINSGAPNFQFFVAKSIGLHNDTGPGGNEYLANIFIFLSNFFLILKKQNHFFMFFL